MASENQAVAKSRGTVRNWTEEEKNIVWEQTEKAQAENLPLTEAFRRTSKLLPHRSEAAVGMLYYNVLRKERQDEQKEQISVPKTTASGLKVDSRLLEAFQGLPEYMQELQQRMKDLETRFSQPDPLAILQSLSQFVAEQEKQPLYEDKVQTLAADNQELRKENEALRNDLEKLKEAYEDALGIYDLFTNMASISQIMSLGDFKQEMKTTLDKWGNVLDITLSRSE